MAVSSNSYKNMIASLLRIAECPVCLETIKIPFKICSKGHGICSRCTEKLKACPTCQGALILENPVSMKNLLEALPQHCRYADDGCDIIAQDGDDHEHVCGYRQILCRISKCEKTVPVMNLLAHYKSEHPSRFVCQEEVVDIAVPDFKPHDSFWSYLPVSLFGNLFWILTINDTREGSFEMFFQATPIGKLENDYYVQVKFEKEKFAYSFTLKASTLHSCTVKYSDKNPDSYREAINGEDDYFFRVPQKELTNFLNDEGKLEYSLTFFEKAK